MARILQIFHVRLIIYSTWFWLVFLSLSQFFFLHTKHIRMFTKALKRARKLLLRILRMAVVLTEHDFVRLRLDVTFSGFPGFGKHLFEFAQWLKVSVKTVKRQVTIFFPFSNKIKTCFNWTFWVLLACLFFKSVFKHAAGIWFCWNGGGGERKRRKFCRYILFISYHFISLFLSK